MDTPFYIVGERRQKPKPQKADGKKAEALVSTDDVVFDRNLFVQQETTDTTKKEVVFDKELRGEYATFLGNYITNLNKLREERDPANPGAFPRRTLLDAILENQNHVHDRELLGLFTKEEFDEEGRLVRASTDSVKIDQFLRTSRGLEITNQLLEYQTTLKLFALALHAAIRPPGYRSNLAEPQLIHTGIDQGMLNGALHRVAEWFNRRVTDVDGRPNIELHPYLRALTRGHVIGGLTLLTGGIALVNPVAGAAVLGGEAAIMAMMRSARGGVTLDLRQCSAAFQTIQANPIEAAYLKATASIDVNDFFDHGGNLITEATLNPGTMRHAENDLKKEVLHGIETRLKFHAALKTPPENLSALPTQSKYWDVPGLRGQPEQTGAHYQLRVKREFDRLGGYVAGNVQQNIERQMHAQRTVLLEDLKNYIHEEQTYNFQAKDISDIDRTKISTIQNKRTARGEGGTLRTERERQFAERKTLYEESRNVLQNERDTKLKPYNDAVIALQRLREETQREFAVLDIVGIDLQIQQRENDLENPTPGSIAEEENQLITDIEAFKAPLLAALPARATDEMINNIDRRANLAFGGRLQALNRRKDRVNAQIARLGEFRTNIETNERALSEDENAVRQQRELFNTLNTDFDFIIGAAGPPPTGIENRINDAIAAGIIPAGALPAGWSLNENDLQALPIDVLIQRINQAHAAAVAAGIADIGWPESNRRPENRLRLMHVMVEARARAAETADVARAARLPDYNNLTGTGPGDYNLTPNQLRTLTNDQINQILARHVPPVGLLPTVIENAREEARSVLRVRNSVYDEQARIFNTLIEQQDEAIAGINFEGEVRQLDLTLELMNKQGEIYSKASNFTYDAPRLLDNNPIAAADPNFTQAERNLGAPRGYYEIMDMLFDYRKRDNREAYFEQISRFLPPDTVPGNTLAGLLNEYLNLGFVPPPPPTMINVLNTAMTGYNLGLLAPPNFRRAFRDIINRLYQEGNAL